MGYTKKESALERHIGFFSHNGNVNYDSIKDKLTQIGDPNAQTKANAISFMAGIKVKRCPYAMFTAAEGIGTLNHPRDTGIYNPDGSLNEARWEILCSYAENDQGVDIITEKRFYEFLQWSRDHDERWDIGGLGKTFSNGEWQDFFTFCKDYWKKTETGSEAAVTIKTLRMFFEDSAEIFNKVINKELPLMQPNM